MGNSYPSGVTGMEPDGQVVYRVREIKMAGRWVSECPQCMALVLGDALPLHMLNKHEELV